MSRLAILLLWLTSPVTLAQADLKVSEAIRHYDGGEFTEAKNTLVTVVESPRLSPPQRSRARIYLAAAYYALGDIASAKAQLLSLARSDPGARLDPALFVPELVALHEDSQREVAAELAARPVDPPPAALGEPRLVPLPPPAAPRPPAHLSLIPFGVGQFANGDSGKGVAFLVGETALFAISATTLGLFESMKVDGQFLRVGYFHPQDRPMAEALHVAYHVAFYAGLALAGTGIVEAVLARSAGGSPPLGWRFTGNSVQVRF